MKLAVTMLVGPPFSPAVPSLTGEAQQWYPVIYALNDPDPLAVCTGRNLPDGSLVPLGQRTYSNISTMKVKTFFYAFWGMLIWVMQHGSFGGPALSRDEYYAAGSSDFRAYVWKIPDSSHLVQQRQHLDIDQWATFTHGDVVGEPRFSHAFVCSDGKHHSGFTASPILPRTIPAELSTPLFRLSGKHALGLCMYEKLETPPQGMHQSLTTR